ncbi:MAG: hypothetical protein IT186_16095 [Acidobacteria bacterium]|nr:hypothetical protein [Acidobacteriota bacterium]
MLGFFRHPGFEREADRFRKKHPAFDEALDSLKRLLEKQFDPDDPVQVIASGLYRIEVRETETVWKVHAHTAGLKRNQAPRVYFSQTKSSITFLAMGTHIENYDDGELRAKAMERLDEVLEPPSE